jgi:catechol 2,3-dioxygenase-like lactoylglutathione lyase family enzyme
MEPRVSLITLGVGDLDRSVSFYRDVLGWPTTYALGDPIAFFQLRGVVLGVFPRAALAEDATVPAQGGGFRGVTFAHNLRSRKAVDAMFERLRSRGVAIVKPPRKAEWGGYSGYIADPDGHLWEIAHNPGWKLDRAGAVLLPK